MEKKIQREAKRTELREKISKEIEQVIPKELKETYKEIHPVEERVEKVVCIKRTTKVTKGGKKLSFSAIVISGDKKGNVGYGFGKANEVPNAIKKAVNSSKKNMMSVPLKGNTIPHEAVGKYSAAIVFLRPAAEGTGVVACNVIRAICDAAGIKDILTKCLKSQTPVNVVKATFEALKKLRFKNELLEIGAESEEK